MSNNIDYKSEYWLYDQLINKEKSIYSMAKDCGVVQSTVRYWLKKFNIQPEKNDNRWLNACYSTYRSSANYRNINWGLELDEFDGLSQDDCFYCGVPPTQIFAVTRKTCIGRYVYNGIDRLDSRQGYTLENCVTSCKRCNQAKNNLSVGDFLLLVEKIYNRRLRY